MKYIANAIGTFGKRNGRPVARYIALLSAEIIKARKEGYTKMQIMKKIGDSTISPSAFNKAVSGLGFAGVSKSASLSINTNHANTKKSKNTNDLSAIKDEFFKSKFE